MKAFSEKNGEKSMVSLISTSSALGSSQNQLYVQISNNFNIQVILEKETPKWQS